MCARRNSNQVEQEDNEVRDRFIPNCVLKEIQIKRSRKITKWLGERVAHRAIGTSFCKNYNSIARDVILLQNNTVLFNAKNYKINTIFHPVMYDTLLKSSTWLKLQFFFQFF